MEIKLDKESAAKMVEMCDAILAQASVGSTELLACPFCGEPAESDMMRGFVAYNYKPGNAVAIYCSKCSADMTLCHGDFPQHTPEELLTMLTEQWNRRQANEKLCRPADSEAGAQRKESNGH